MKAKKHLGQHFLNSEKALLEIVASLDLSNKDIVLEIGPGQGVLTEELLSTTKKVIAVEKDTDMVIHLQHRFDEDIKKGNLEIINGDILEFDTGILRKYLQYKIVGNIPYYITGAIIEKFLSTPFQPTCAVFLIQKEVAERIVAKDKKESVLSIAVKAYGAPSIISKVKAGSFNPPPKVDSAIIKIENISRNFFEGISEELFFSVLKTIFGKKRKQIGGSLAEYLENKDQAVTVLKEVAIDTKTRPEDLNLMHWKKLVMTLAEVKNSVK